jgi:hypothetical protein
MKSLRAGALVLAWLAATTACVDDPTNTGSPIPMTLAEAEVLGLDVLYHALAARLEADIDEDAPGAGPNLAGAAGYGAHAAGVPVEIDEQASAAIPCATSGDIQVTVAAFGTIDDEAGTGDLTFRIVLDHEACETSREGHEFELAGFPDLAVELRFTATQNDRLTLYGEIDGGVLVSRDGSFLGLCVADVVITGAVDAETQMMPISMTGSMCGAPIDRTTVADLGSSDPGG